MLLSGIELRQLFWKLDLYDFLLLFFDDVMFQLLKGFWFDDFFGVDLRLGEVFGEFFFELVWQLIIEEMEVQEMNGFVNEVGKMSVVFFEEQGCCFCLCVIVEIECSEVFFLIEVVLIECFICEEKDLIVFEEDVVFEQLLFEQSWFDVWRFEFQVR